MTTAYVLSGGASLGAVQVGMLLALTEAGITPDLIVGTSVGALNGGWVSSRCDVAGIGTLADTWRSVSRHDVFPARPLTALLGFMGRRRNLVPDSGLRQLLTRNLEFDRLEDAAIPLHVVATDLLSGADVLISRGDAVDAILASAAIPGIFPPVSIDGRDHIDGGVVNNSPLSHAIAVGADTVWVLPTGYACALRDAPKGALSMALHGFTLATNRQLAIDVERYETAAELRVIPPPCPIRTTPVDFSRASQLIERGYQSARTWIPTRRPARGQAVLLEPHVH